MALESGITIGELNQSWPLGTDPKTTSDDHLRLIKQVLKSQFPGSGGEGFTSAITATEAQLNALDTLVTTSKLETRLSLIEVDLVNDVQLIESTLATMQSQINDGAFPSGTTLLFHQNSAPPGWTKRTDHNNKMLCVVSGNVSTGGSHEPRYCNVVAAHTHYNITSTSSAHNHTGTTGSAGSHTHHTWTGNDSPNHTHQYTYTHNVGLQKPGGVGVGFQGIHSHITYNTSGVSTSHTHGVGMNSAGNHSHSMNTSWNGAHSHSGTTHTNSGATNWTPKYLDMILATKN